MSFFKTFFGMEIILVLTTLLAVITDLISPLGIMAMFVFGTAAISYLAFYFANQASKKGK